MISKSLYETDVRVRREAEALVEDGHAVTVACLGSEALVNGVRVLATGEVTGLKRSTGPLGSLRFREAVRWLLLPVHRRLANSQFSDAIRQLVDDHELVPDVVHAHDFPALQAFAHLGMNDRIRLVYDAHEYWRGMPRQGRPTPLAALLERRREQRLAQTSSAIITVSNEAAELLSEDLEARDIQVVRNTFPKRQDMTATRSPTGAVYAGRIAEGRDLQTIFTASVWDDLALSLHLKGSIADETVVPRWVELHPSGSLDSVDRLLAANGIALIPLDRGPVNHEVALPNKLFQAISVGVPVVAANLRAMARVVSEHGIGTLYEPGDANSLRRALSKVAENYQDLADNCLRARNELDWSVDAAKLRSLYRDLENADV